MKMLFSNKPSGYDSGTLWFYDFLGNNIEEEETKGYGDGGWEKTKNCMHSLENFVNPRSH